jgi:hypothetical protein
MSQVQALEQQVSTGEEANELRRPLERRDALARRMARYDAKVQRLSAGRDIRQGHPAVQC